MQLSRFLRIFSTLFLLSIFIIGPAFAKKQEHLNLDVTAIKTRDLLKMLAQYANKNIIISEQITSNTTLALHHVTWRVALDAVLHLHKLVKYETAHVITILLAEEFIKRESEFLQSAVFNLYYMSAQQVAITLKNAGVLSSQGKLSAELGANVLVVVDTNERLTVVKQLLRELDIPSQQILIEARIVSADSLFLQKLGVELSTAEHLPLKTPNINIRGRSQPPVIIQQGQFNLRLTKLSDNSFLDIQLSALENSGRGKAHPKLLTTDRQEAVIEVGAEIPYQERNKDGHTNTMFKKAVLSLKVTPEIVATNAVNLVLHLNQDKVSQTVISGTPAIDTRKISTQVLVYNNETIVLGGIYEWSKVTRTTGIPLLGRIPILGLLFSKKETHLERKELLIFVTPRIIAISSNKR